MDLHSTYPGVADLKARARRRVPKFVWEFLDSGTGAEATKARNRAALDRVGFLPSILHGPQTADTATTFLGQDFPVPFGIAPIGMSGLIWPGAARLLARVMPPSVETFRLVPVAGGMALSAVTLRRSDLEALEFEPMATDALRAVSGIGEATPRPDPGALRSTDLYPNFRWSLGPYFLPSYFDPAKPVRMDVGIELVGAYEFAPGWTLAGALRHRLAGNVSGGRGSNSVLPHVRTDQTQYAQADTTLQNLFLSYQWRPGRNLYARVSAGYFERMYGGLSAELLWKPVDSRIGLGLEANYARQRDFDQRLGFRDYSVLTGHASAYMELGGGYLAQVDAGRHLAGDLGATFALAQATSLRAWIP